MRWIPRKIKHLGRLAIFEIHCNFKDLAYPCTNAEERRFLEDGDEVFLRARARRQGFATIGFGECRGAVLPAPAYATTPERST